ARPAPRGGDRSRTDRGREPWPASGDARGRPGRLRGDGAADRGLALAHAAADFARAGRCRLRPDLRSQLRVEQRESELIEELWHAFVAQRAELDLALASIGGA